MKPLSRRRALQLGGLGLAGTAVAGGTWVAIDAGGPAEKSDPQPVPAALVEPEVLASAAGRLSVRLEAP